MRITFKYPMMNWDREENYTDTTVSSLESAILRENDWQRHVGRSILSALELSCATKEQFNEALDNRFIFQSGFEVTNVKYDGKENDTRALLEQLIEHHKEFQAYVKSEIDSIKQQLAVLLPVGGTRNLSIYSSIVDDVRSLESKVRDLED